jgi:RNA recognition motif-containing protein
MNPCVRKSVDKSFYTFKERTELKNLKKIFIGNLPPSTNENDLQILFSKFGTVRSIKLVTDIFTEQCKGFGFIGMEGHEARSAIAGLDGKDFNGNLLKVEFEYSKSIHRNN